MFVVAGGQFGSLSLQNILKKKSITNVLMREVHLHTLRQLLEPPPPLIDPGGRGGDQAALTTDRMSRFEAEHFCHPLSGSIAVLPNWIAMVWT